MKLYEMSLNDLQGNIGPEHNDQTQFLTVVTTMGYDLDDLLEAAIVSTVTEDGEDGLTYRIDELSDSKYQRAVRAIKDEFYRQVDKREAI